eukprot:2957464-Pyramimonas_sp.AAC.1
MALLRRVGRGACAQHPADEGVVSRTWLQRVERNGRVPQSIGLRRNGADASNTENEEDEGEEKGGEGETEDEGR